ncbi:MAG TPA: hypothetical protein IGS53_14885 [Leptolyngbyaceae cyanobacterium M33_DOE_097]|nr:hypothetical protein [Leptolyngbyaceae cyanobacterium M33_DOE_097]
MSIQGQVRSLTTRRRRSERNRQSSMVVRAAVELGLNEPTSDVDPAQNQG